MAPGGVGGVEMVLRVGDLQRWDEGEGGAYVVDPGVYSLAVSTCLLPRNVETGGGAMGACQSKELGAQVVLL